MYRNHPTLNNNKLIYMILTLTTYTLHHQYHSHDYGADHAQTTFPQAQHILFCLSWLKENHTHRLPSLISLLGVYVNVHLEVPPLFHLSVSSLPLLLTEA